MKIFIVILCFISIDLVSEEPQQCPLYEKYKNKMTSDPGDAQLWAQCAGAALEVCQATSDKVKEERLAVYAKNIKNMAQSGTCPCSDVIPDKLWKGGTSSGNSSSKGFFVSTDYEEYTGSYKQLLKMADEYYYSGDYTKALDAYKAASKANGGSDNYLKNRIASLSQYGGKTTNSGTANTNKQTQDVNSYVENLINNTPTLKTTPSNQFGNKDKIIDQYENLLKEYIVAFKNSLSGNEVDLDFLLKKTNQLEELNILLNPDSNSFTEIQLARISSISENFSDALLNLANSYGAETIEENRRYVRARGVELPKSLLQVPGAYSVDPNPKQNNGGYYIPSNNTLPASVATPTTPPGVWTPQGEKKEKKSSNSLPASVVTPTGPPGVRTLREKK